MPGKSRPGIPISNTVLTPESRDPDAVPLIVNVLSISALRFANRAKSLIAGGRMVPFATAPIETTA